MDLEVEGRHALLFDDDSTAAFVNSREALVPWNDDASLLIDRYDVRHLLDRIPARPPRRPLPGRSPPSRLEEAEGVSQSELDLERYLDLPPPADEDGRDEGDSKSETIKRSEATGGGAYQAVPFSYGNTDSMVEYTDSGSNISGFHPPFPVPESLLSNLPPSEKLHQIISRTAIFVSEHGGQSEIVLRVKQGDNPTFGFLMPDHHLHAYFRYLVDHPQLLKANANCSTTQEKISDERENEKHSAAVGALSLLGSVYGSGDDDDDDAVQAVSKEMKSTKSNISGNAAVPHRSEHDKSSISTAPEDKQAIKHPVTAVKEKKISFKRNHTVNAASSTAAGSKKAGDGHVSPYGALDRPQCSQSDIKPLILEPPSALKGTIDKIVEFILRNGKEFEAILIEQDKTTGRFPFLLPSNLYHSYYLKILDEARELKVLGKNLSDQKHDVLGQFGSKKRKQEASTREHNVYDSDFAWQLEGGSCDLQRKEKFKMIVGGSKKDTRDQRPTPARQSGASVDEVAAILLAATRGLSPAKPDHCPLPVRRSGASVDEAAAIVMAATRGSSPANADQLPMPARKSEVSADEAAIVLAVTRGSSPADAFKNISVDESDAVRTLGDSKRASSIGSFSSLRGRNSSLKPLSQSETCVSLPVNLSGSTGHLPKDSIGKSGDVLVAKAIAKTAALVASNEADSSEACLTKEQKLKAERLKRAKIFAAMIKSGDHAVTDSVHSSTAVTGSLEASNAGSIRSVAESDVIGKEREGSSMLFDAEILERTVPRDLIYDHNREHRSRKKHLSRSRDLVDDSEEDYNHSKKQHRSEHSSHHSRNHHKHRMNHPASKDKESRHHHKHNSSSEGEHRHRKGSRSRHRHTNQELTDNEDEERKRSDGHRKKHHSHYEKREIGGEGKTKTLDHLDVSQNSSYHHEEVAKKAASNTHSSDATEVPSDLRAKIRAMLLETM